DPPTSTPQRLNSSTLKRLDLTPFALPRTRRRFLRHLFCFLAYDDSRKLYHFRRHVAVLAERGFERQFTIGDLSQGDIGMTHPRNEFDQRTMSKGKLPNTA